MLDESAIDELLAGLPNPGAQRFLHACTHTTFSPNVVGTKGQPKTNVIPDIVDLDIDIRTMPGEHTDEVTAHLRAALGDELFERVEVEILMDDPASISRTDTPLWDALQRAVLGVRDDGVDVAEQQHAALAGAVQTRDEILGVVGRGTRDALDRRLVGHQRGADRGALVRAVHVARGRGHRHKRLQLARGPLADLCRRLLDPRIHGGAG